MINFVKRWLAGVYAKLLLRAASRELRKAQEEDR